MPSLHNLFFCIFSYFLGRIHFGTAVWARPFWRQLIWLSAYFGSFQEGSSTKNSRPDLFQEVTVSNFLLKLTRNPSYIETNCQLAPKQPCCKGAAQMTASNSSISILFNSKNILEQNDIFFGKYHF